RDRVTLTSRTDCKNKEKSESRRELNFTSYLPLKKLFRNPFWKKYSLVRVYLHQSAAQYVGRHCCHHKCDSRLCSPLPPQPPVFQLLLTMSPAVIQK
ncbi:hypothetical protein J0S82_014238, partial [Galemys pyrenaicus]